MFTGIVTDIGKVCRIEKRGDTHIAVETHYDLAEIEVGGSIACSGICLTVADKGDGKARWFAVTASEETVSKTNLGEWKPGTAINLEQPVRVGDELGGHIVTGHIDGTAEISSVRPEGESLRIVFRAPRRLMRFIAPKGSVALDGVSLTVNEVDGSRFGVNIISHTSNATTFGRAWPGAKVNLEIDLMARYVARLAAA